MSLDEHYLLDDEEAPPGPLEAAEPPPVPPLLDDEPPLIPPLVDEPIPLPDVPPVPELVVESVVGELGDVEVEDDEEPPGTMTVSFSRVVVDVDPLGDVVLPPGITVVVSFFSQADNAKAPITTNRNPLRLMFTLLSSEKSLQNASRF